MWPVGVPVVSLLELPPEALTPAGRSEPVDRELGDLYRWPEYATRTSAKPAAVMRDVSRSWS
jgi:hypothetical protein